MRGKSDTRMHKVCVPRGGEGTDTCTQLRRRSKRVRKHNLRLGLLFEDKKAGFGLGSAKEKKSQEKKKKKGGGSDHFGVKNRSRKSRKEKATSENSIRVT